MKPGPRENSSERPFQRLHFSERTTYPGGSHQRTTEYEGDNVSPKDAEHLNQPSGFPLLRVIALTGTFALLAVALNNAEGIVNAIQLLTP